MYMPWGLQVSKKVKSPGAKITDSSKQIMWELGIELQPSAGSSPGSQLLRHLSRAPFKFFMPSSSHRSQNKCAPSSPSLLEVSQL